MLVVKILTVGLVFVLGIFQIYRWVRAIDKAPEEYDMCQNCQVGWCDAVPGDNECKSIREYFEDTEWDHRHKDLY